MHSKLFFLTIFFTLLFYSSCKTRKVSINNTVEVYLLELANGLDASYLMAEYADLFDIRSSNKSINQYLVSCNELNKNEVLQKFITDKNIITYKLVSTDIEPPKGGKLKGGNKTKPIH